MHCEQCASFYHKKYIHIRIYITIYIYSYMCVDDITYLGSK